jgi:choline dehydrogenase-like flavoprotein
MIVDLQQHEAPLDFSADVCIAGAGAAGLVLAAELVRQGRRVLLLESGGLSAEADPQTLNQCVYTGQPRHNADRGRRRALGGTTTLWGGQILELEEEDFSARSWIPGSGWPFPKSDLAPYYERALAAEGLSKAIRDDNDVWRELNIATPELGEAFAAYFTRWCPEPNFAHLYSDAVRSPQLCILLHATAVAMVFSEDDSRVCGIECVAPPWKSRTFSAREYVLCLGTIESTRFLLQPMEGDQTPSWNRSGLLGRHFQSHIDGNVAAIPAESVLKLQRWFSNVYLRGLKYHPKFRLTLPCQQREGILNIAASITCINPAEIELRRAKAAARNLAHGRLAEIKWRSLGGILHQIPTMAKLAYSYRVRRRAAWPKNSNFWLRVHCEQEPLSKSQIELADTRDATGLLQARVDWRVSPLEWKTIRCFAEEAKRTFVALGIGEIELIPELAREDGSRELTFDASHHDMGGTRIAADAGKGVVDTDLRLYGLANAYVCSASVFPCSGFSNPTHTLIALALRLADHLARRLSAEAGPAIVASSSSAGADAHA